MAAQTHVDVAGMVRPAGQLDYATALQPRAGRLGERSAAHLLRRAGFGGTADEISRYAAMSAAAAVAALLEVPPARSIGAPQELIDAPHPAPRKIILTLQMWWLERMLATPAPLQEKMALYFHGHFTSRGTPRFPWVTFNQNQLFREYALGNLRDLTRNVAKDAAMLIYLNGNQNVAAHPNENFARELMELFTLGVDNYTEQDVRESARAWTGWRVDRHDQSVYYDYRLHDDGRKNFLGRSGYFNGDDIVNIIFEQPQCARFFAASLLNWFVYNDPEPQLVDGVAALLRARNFELAPVVATILRSNVFYSERAYRALVKSPVEFVIGTYKALGLTAMDRALVLPALQQMGQRLFFPPSVAGWPGGQNWLTSGTMIARQNFLTRLIFSLNAADSSALAGLPLQARAAGEKLTNDVLQNDVSPASLAEISGYLNGAGSAALAPLSPENFDLRTRGAAYLALATPSFQLC